MSESISLVFLGRLNGMAWQFACRQAADCDNKPKGEALIVGFSWRPHEDNHCDSRRSGIQTQTCLSFLWKCDEAELRRLKGRCCLKRRIWTRLGIYSNHSIHKNSQLTQKDSSVDYADAQSIPTFFWNLLRCAGPMDGLCDAR